MVNKIALICRLTGAILHKQHATRGTVREELKQVTESINKAIHCRVLSKIFSGQLDRLIEHIVEN